MHWIKDIGKQAGSNESERLVLSIMSQLSDNSTGEWWKKAVFYQIYPRSFQDSNGDGIGDIRGIIERLDYLNDGTPGSLGIDAIWFSPFFRSPDHDFGYDIADYCNIDPRYGSLDDFDRLLEEAHKRKIKVMLDLVVNHTSINHPWFRESRSSKDNPKRNWYIWKEGRSGGNKPPNNWRNNFFGSAWTRDSATGQYYLHSFLREQPDLNWENQEVREAIKNVIRFWLNRGVDGFRLDVAHIYCKDPCFRNNPPFFMRKKGKNGLPCADRVLMANLMRLLSAPEFQVRKYNQHQPETHQVLKEFRTVFDEYSATTSVGEILADEPSVIAAYYGRENDELHMNFYFELLHLKFKAGAFRRAIEKWEHTLPGGAWPAYTLSNHDVMRMISRYDSGGRGEERARLLLLMLLSLRGTPFIYYGEELGLREARLKKEDLKDPVGLKWYPLHPGRDGCRTPMQWTAGAYAGFSTVEPWLPLSGNLEKCNAAQQEEDEGSMLNFLKKMIWLRKDLPALVEGSYRTLKDEVPAACFAYVRESQDQKLAIYLNFSNKNVEITADEEGNRARLIISTDPERGKAAPGNYVLGPYEGHLYEYK